MNKPFELPLLRDDAPWPDHLHHEATRIDAGAEARRQSAGDRVGISRPHESAHLHVAGAAPYIDDLPDLAGTLHAALYGGADYPQHADATIVRFAMIETAEALDNLDAILSVEGLDAIYIGPSDLSLALGCKPTFDDVDPPVAQAITHILERAQAHGVVAGIHNGTPEAARERIGKGFRFVTVGSDARLMAAGAQQVLAKMRASA